MAQNFLSDIQLGDNIYIRLGNATNGDLQIYHDGSNSYIDETGTGDLIIKGGNDITFKDAVDNLLINMNQSNSVELYFGGSKKFQTDTNGVEVIGGLGVGRYPSPVYGIYQEFNSTDPNHDNKFAYFIDGNFSGADNTDGDREQGGIKIDIDSSADGDASDEHRLYGVWSDIRYSGFTDVARGIYTYTENNNSTGSEVTAETTAMYASSVSDGTSATAGTNNLRGVYGQAIVQNGGYAFNSYGVFGLASLSTNRSLNTDAITGTRGEVAIDSTNSITLTNARALQAIVDINNTAPTITNSYLLYGGYEGDTSSITNKYGLYLIGSDNINRLDGVTMFQPGTAAAPSITRLAERDTGIYFPATDTIGFTTGGLERARIGSDGTITLNAYGAGYLKTDANGVISVDTSTIEDTLQSVTDRGSTTTNNITLDDNTTESPYVGYIDNSGANSSDIEYRTYSTNGNFIITRTGNNGADIMLSGHATDHTSSTTTFAGDVTVGGDLIVSGDTVTLSTQTVEVEDNIIQLNTTQGSPDTATATTSGISVYRGDGVTQASFIFDDSDDTWDLTNNLKVESKLGIGSLNTSYDLYNNGSTYLNGAVTIDHNLDITSNGVIRMGGTEVISAARAINATSGTFAGEVTTEDLTIKNPSGTVGFTQIGTIHNHSGNSYVRGSIIFSRNEDDVTWSSANSEWTRGGGSSNDFSAILHTSNSVRFLAGPAISSTTTYTNTQFLDAFEYMRATTSGNVTFFNNVLIPSGYVGRDAHNRINFDTDDSIIFRVADTYRARFDSDALKPYADSSYDLGTSALRFANIYADTLYGDGSNLTGVTSTDTSKLPLAGGTLTGQVIFPSAATTKPVLPNGFIARNDNSDTSGRHDIWGISERYYPSSSTSSDAWGIQWSGTPNDIVFVGAGTDRFTISLDEGNITSAGNVQATSYIQSDSNFLTKGTLKFRNNADSSWLNGFRRVSGADTLELINISNINSSGGGTVTFADNITVQGATTRLENNVTVGNSSADYLEVRYNDTANYATRLKFNGVQFGNNGGNKIIAGRTGANGYFDFYVNNTNEGLAGTPDGDLALTIAANKDASFTGNVNIYTGAGSATLNVGRNSSERLQTHVTDTNITLTATNDADENQEHNFILDRSFGGSGENAFRVRKGGANQFTIDSGGTARLHTGGLLVDNGQVQLAQTGTDNLVVIQSGGATNAASEVGVRLIYTGPGGSAEGSIKMIEQGNNSPNAKFRFSLPKDSGNGVNSTSSDVLDIDQNGDAYFTRDVFTPGLYVNTAGSAVSGTQVAIVGSGNENLQRWGSSTSGQASYRFRIDQNYHFIGNSGSGDMITIESNTGNISTSGNVVGSNLTASGYVQSQGPDGGLALRTWTGGSSYGSFSTANMSGDEYAVLTDGTHTFISGGTGGSVHIRAGNNVANHELEISSNLATFKGNLQVNGNLNIVGNSSVVNVEDLNVEQGEITLNYNASSDTSGSANGSGIRIQDAVSATTDATMLWDASSDRFDFSHALTTATGTVRFTHQQNGGSRLELYNNRQDLSNVEVYRIAAYNSVEVTGVHFYRGAGGSSGYTKIFSKKNNSSSLEEVVQFGTNDALTTTFAAKVRANSWFQGADGTNTLYSNATAGTLIQTAGNTADNNDSKIYFRNSATTVKHTFDTNSGDATFAGTITAAGGSSNNNDDANILTLNASEHARLLVDTSSTSGHRATLALESNGNELILSNTGSASELTSVGNLTVTSSSTTFSGSVTVESGSINNVIQYTKAYSSLDTTGQAVAGLVTSTNGASAMFVFETGGGNGSGGYQKIVYNCVNVSGTWSVYKDIDEGGNLFDVTGSGGTTVTFTFKGRTANQSYTPRVVIKALGGSAINTTYI